MDGCDVNRVCQEAGLAGVGWRGYSDIVYWGRDIREDMGGRCLVGEKGGADCLGRD